MHLKAAKVEFHGEPSHIFNALQVVIRHGEKEWKSEPKEHQRNEARWELAIADFEVLDYKSEIFIEVRDADAPLENEPLGKHHCNVGWFVQKGDDWEDWIPLHLMEQPAGRIHLKTKFILN